MARKTFRERTDKVLEGAWMVTNEIKEIKAMITDLEEENIRLTEEVRILRLQLARNKTNHHQSFAHNGN